jgi:dihydropteroate synthase
LTPAQFNLWLGNSNRRPLIMGVLNVTPDSFSDGGRFQEVDAARAQAKQMSASSAALIDIGGESTRPGSQPIPAQEQIRRIVPVIRALSGSVPALLSVDTTLAAVAEAALDAGAHLINDVSAGRDDSELLPLVARRRVPIILMHMQGKPATMQSNPSYEDVTGEVVHFLQERIAAAVEAGISRSSILIDPGIGFGKTTRHNLELLRRFGELATIDRPVVIGTSRKGFIGEITGEDLSSGRPFGTAATVAWTVANGAGIVRVHDVEPMSQVLRMIEAIQNK